MRAARVFILALGAMALAGCATAPVGPENPGTRVSYKNPDPAKWIGERAAGDRRSVFKCRPLACPERSFVSIRTGRSPTRSPDPQALQKYAQEAAAKEMAEAEEASSEAAAKLQALTLVSSRVAPVREFPAITWEYKALVSGKPIYLVRKTIFAGNTMIDVLSASLGLEVARRNSNDFVGILEIEDFAPKTS